MGRGIAIKNLPPGAAVSVRFYCRWCARFAYSVTFDGGHWRCDRCEGCVEPEARVRQSFTIPIRDGGGIVSFVPNIEIDENGDYAGEVPEELRPAVASNV